MDKIGKRIRALRQERHLTLKELANQCGLSASFLSQVERGLSSASIASLHTIAKIMGVPLGTFFEDADHRPGASTRGTGRTMKNSVVKHTEESLIRLSNAMIKYTFLSNDFPGRQFEIVIGEIQPGTTYPLVPHEGEEFGYVLEGHLKFMIEDQTYSLGPGDSYHFDAMRPHTYQADGESLVRVLWVGTLKYFQDRAHSGPLRNKPAAL